METLVKVIAQSTALLAQVIALGDANRNFLGHFPFSAYEREAGKGRIIGAIGADGQLMAYLLYRIARGRAVVQHCCVANAHRGSGVGKRLVAELKSRTASLFGIELHCAREFAAACAFWESNGFVAFGEKPGRGADRRTLTRYVFDHRNGDLFTSQLDSLSADCLLVVVDTNVAYDWQDWPDPSRPTADESMALRADWLAEEIDLRITDHAFADADASDDTALRERRKKFLTGLPKVNEDREVARELEANLVTILNPSSRRSAAIDVRHIATAAAAGADVFVTHDAELLRASAEIEASIGIALCAPATLIARLDEDLRAAKYQPIRLAGSAVVVRQFGATDLAQLPREFYDYGSGERIAAFELRIRQCMAAPDRSSLQVVEWPSGKPIGLLATECRGTSTLGVPILRFRGSEVTTVLLRHAAVMLVKSAIARECAVIDVMEPQVNAGLGEALREAGFVPSNGRWRRFVPVGLHSRSGLVSWFEDGLFPNGDGVARERGALCRTGCAQAIERDLWPVKLAGEPLPTFIVPIRPRWAVHLFDEGLASGTLHGGQPALMFNTENVYYKSGLQQVLAAPGRILWYVSDDGESPGVGRIRACSPILEVETGPAKSLYAKYRRLGVYEWRDLMGVTRGEPQGPLMAVRFGVTECFKLPVSRGSIREVLESFGKAMPPLTTAYALPDGAFEEIYALGSKASS